MDSNQNITRVLTSSDMAKDKPKHAGIASQDASGQARDTSLSQVSADRIDSELPPNDHDVQQFLRLIARIVTRKNSETKEKEAENDRTPKSNASEEGIFIRQSQY